MRPSITPISFTLAFAAFSAVPTTAATPPVTTLCELAANPAKWGGRTIHLTATYMSDRLERSLLVDDRCPKVWFQDRNSKKGHRESLEAFYRAVWGDGQSVRTTDFVVDIIGRVSYRREGRASGRITILRVLNYQEFERPKRQG
jgi:hypothetical protein